MRIPRKEPAKRRVLVSGAHVPQARALRILSARRVVSWTTDCQQDEFRWGHGPLTFERVRAAMGLA